MNDDRWRDLLGDIKLKFEIESQEIGDYLVRTPSGSEVKQGEIEAVIFKGAMGKMKLERISRPKILDRKVHAHKRKADGWVEYITSEEEKSHEVLAYRFNPQTESWIKIDLKNF